MKGPIDSNNVSVPHPAGPENGPSLPQESSSEAVNLPEAKSANPLGATAEDILSYSPLENTGAYLGTVSEADTAIATTGETVGWMNAAGIWFGAALGTLNPAAIVALALVGLGGVGYGVYYAYRLYGNNIRSQQTLESGAESAQKGLSDDNRDAVGVVAQASGQERTTNASSASLVPTPLPTLSPGSGAASTPAKAEPRGTAGSQDASIIGAWDVTWGSPYMYSTGLLTVGPDYLARWTQKDGGNTPPLGAPYKDSSVRPPFGCTGSGSTISYVPFKQISPGLYTMSEKTECLNDWTETVQILVSGNALRAQSDDGGGDIHQFSGKRLK